VHLIDSEVSEMSRMVLDCVERSLQSIIADAIQHFPNEAAGLLFGNLNQMDNTTICECVCSIPIGEVEERSQTEIWLSTRTISKILAAEYMAIGYKILGQFHTHPQSGLSDPSEDDLKEFKLSKFPIMVICGISNIEASEPIGKWSSGTNLRGSIANYAFQIGAYAKVKDNIIPIEIASPFVQIYNLLRDLGLGLNQISDLHPKELSKFQYAIDKLEYWWRLDNITRKPEYAENKASYEENVIRNLLKI
jgi:proteasome lid subunit RPN8/RPN11